MQQPSLRDRYRGAMVGVLAGDALGAPYETWKAVDILVDLRNRGGLVPFDYPNPWAKTEPPPIFPKGRPTDDSDHTAALAESLIAMKGVDQEDIFKRLKHVVFDHVSPLWDGRAFGAGKTTRNMLRPPTWEESKALDSSDAFPSNGSLMRAVPLALFFGSTARFDDRMVNSMSEVTHRHGVAKECCAAYIRILLSVLEGKKFVDLFDSLPGTVADPELKAILANPYVEPRDPETWPGRGAATLTLHVAYRALVSSILGFKYALSVDVIALGGDTDTYGAVAGGLLGAKFGIDAIPQEWQSILIGREKMIELADKLYDIAHS